MQTDEPTQTEHLTDVAEETIAITPQPETTENTSQLWRAAIHPWWKATLAVLPTFLITRLIFIVLTYLGGILFSVPNYSQTELGFRSVLYTWYRWDAIRFITIATKGYISPDYAAFFPLYPALEHAFNAIFHSDILLTGMLISNLAFFGSLIVLYRLTETEFDRATARRTIFYLAIFPTALFFFAAYNESLFLLFMLLAFYTLRRGQWWLAGIFGALATLTRSIGLLLAVIFICEFLRQKLPELRQQWKEKQTLPLLRSLSGLPAIALIPLALGIYAYGLKIIMGDPLAFSHAQAEWRTGLNFPWVAPLRGLKFLLQHSIFTFTAAHILIDLGALGLFLALMALCLFGPERLPRHQWTFVLFGLMALIFAVTFPAKPVPGGLLYDPIPSTERFVLEIFVGFIMLARLGRHPRFHLAYLLFALPLLAFLTLIFMTGRWLV
ncbi:MAG TPA: mannosyltransferase family protein [Ktedonobacteraceae bacterium]|nr:mannosyltransferase family protein [Ktedonobacteraceae bacterium]